MGHGMVDQRLEFEKLADLRGLAAARLSVPGRPNRAAMSPAAALGVLHGLASSPATAADALALLHELQVHQVELELQAEELRNARLELEAALARQHQLYDFAPVGCFAVDRQMVMHELNVTGATLLGQERNALLGRKLDAFLVPHSARALGTMIGRLESGSRGEAGALELADPVGAPHVVQAGVNADPAGGRFFVALMDLRGYR
jgi:PAS domain-containing protein